MLQAHVGLVPLSLGLQRLTCSPGKLSSGCPEWNFGTAMQHHHRTTCIPKPFARALHRWSRSRRISELQGLLTLWLEGPLSLLALSGWPLGRAVCAGLWCGLMAGIAVSGNYGRSAIVRLEMLPMAAYKTNCPCYPCCKSYCSLIAMGI